MSQARPGPRFSMRHEVSEGIKRHILRNGLRPGDPLPTETALCAALGASRSSVREAVKTLHALDIVEVRHGHGTYVGRLGLAPLVESLTFRALLGPDGGRPAPLELREAIEQLERGAADRIVAALQEPQWDALDALAERIREAGTEDRAGHLDADLAFHTLLVEPLGSRLPGRLAAALLEVYATVAAAPGRGAPTAAEADPAAAYRRIAEAARAADVPAFTAALAAHHAAVRARFEEPPPRPAGG